MGQGSTRAHIGGRDFESCGLVQILGQADPELIAALVEVVTQGASDLHLTVDAPPMLRINGSLQPAGISQPWSREKVVSALFSILSQEQKENNSQL